jgi:hypothetical protein
VSIASIQFTGVRLSHVCVDAALRVQGRKPSHHERLPFLDFEIIRLQVS